MFSRTLSNCALLLCLSGCVAAPRQAPTPPPVCGKLDNMLHNLEKHARYAYTADAIDTQGKVHMWFVNPRTHKWVQLHVYSNLRACIEESGTYWHWAIEH